MVGTGRWVVGGIIAAAVVVVLLLVAIAVFTGGREVELEVKSVPSDLTLKLDGDVISANGITKISSGKHTLEASRSGFKTETQSFDTGGNDLMKSYFVLETDGREGEDWYRDHPKEAREGEAESGRQFDEAAKRRREANPIMQHLPYVGPRFLVNWGPSLKYPKDMAKIRLIVKVWDQEGRDKATLWLQRNKIDPATQEITWTKP